MSARAFPITLCPSSCPSVRLLDFFVRLSPDDEVVSAQFGMDFMNHPFKPI